MSDIKKCPNLVRGVTFFKNVPNSKMSQRSEGGGQPLLGNCPKFSRFSILMAPLSSLNALILFLILTKYPHMILLFE